MEVVSSFFALFIYLAIAALVISITIFVILKLFSLENLISWWHIFIFYLIVIISPFVLVFSVLASVHTISPGTNTTKFGIAALFLYTTFIPTMIFNAPIFPLLFDLTKNLKIVDIKLFVVFFVLLFATVYYYYSGRDSESDSKKTLYDTLQSSLFIFSPSILYLIWDYVLFPVKK